MVAKIFFNSKFKILFLGDEVAKFTSVPIQNSVVVGSWKTTNDSPGGDYKISVAVEESSSDMVFAKAERSFEVREFSGK